MSLSRLSSSGFAPALELVVVASRAVVISSAASTATGVTRRGASVSVLVSALRLIASQHCSGSGF